MTTDLIWHASGFEILFGVSAIIGALISRRNFHEAWIDYRAAAGITNGRRYVAVATIAIELILGSVHAFYVIATLVAISIPAPESVTVVGVLIQSILVYASWGMTTISYITRKVRRYLDSHGLQARDEHGRFVKEL